MWNIKKFQELYLSELEEIFKLRQSIFIIEQKSLFNDIDGLDNEAIHIFFKENDLITSYCRLIINDNIDIGRVIVHPEYRGKGKGKELFQYALNYCNNHYQSLSIHIAAMSYLEEFYRSFGFKSVSEMYDIAGHTHVDMKLII